MIYKSILEQIGNTPMVRINNFNLKKGVEVFAKLEGANPGGSIKDRIALRMIRQAEKKGELTKRKTIIEPTSGNTGIGLAMIGTVLGYSVEIVMSRAVSVERQKMIKAYGAKIILTDEKLGTDGAILEARQLVKKNPKNILCRINFLIKTISWRITKRLPRKSGGIWKEKWIILFLRLGLRERLWV